MGIFHDDALNSLGYSLHFFLRIFCIFSGSSHWSSVLVPCLQPGRAWPVGLTAPAACARTITPSTGPPEDQLQHQAADWAGEGVPLQQVPDRAGRAGVSGALQLGETQVKVWVRSRRTKFTEGAAARCHTHALMDTCPALGPSHPPPPVCARFTQASPWSLSPRWMLIGRSAQATFTFRSGQINPSSSLAELVCILKFKLSHCAPANEQPKWN